jgi:hypothetical protein
MTSLVSAVVPSVTNMIRLDHTHVLSSFHQLRPDASTRVKKGLVNTICTSMEVHAQLEEEIFNPAIREVVDDERIRESLAERTEMKRVIRLLRQMEPEAIDSDEETIVVPAAEKKLRNELGDLGSRMTRRRLQLVAPRTGEIALDMGREVSGNTAALAFCRGGRRQRARHRPGAGALEGSLARLTRRT